MNKTNKESKREMTLGEVCRIILREGRDTVLDYIYSITDKKPNNK